MGANFVLTDGRPEVVISSLGRSDRGDSDFGDSVLIYAIFCPSSDSGNAGSP